MSEINYEAFVKNIGDLAAQKNIPRNKALIDSGVGKDFVTNITKGSTPSIDKIFKLSNYFNVSIDYLLGLDDKTDRQEKSSASELTDTELELLEKFRHLLDIDKGRILDRMDTIYASYSPEQKENVS